MSANGPAIHSFPLPSPDLACVVCRCTVALPCPGGCAWVSERPALCTTCGGTQSLGVFAQLMEMRLPVGIVCLLLSYTRSTLLREEVKGLAGTPVVQELVRQLEQQLVAGGALSEKGLAQLHHHEARLAPRIVLPGEIN